MNWVFDDCSLTSITSLAVTPPKCTSWALGGIDIKNCTLYVPANCSDKYKEADQWECFVTIEEMKAVLVDEIRLNESEINVNVDETFQLSAEILPSNATDKSIIWESSNPEIVTIDENGMVTALSYGIATIVAKSADGNCEATCLVTVNSQTGINDVTVISADIPYVVCNLQGIIVLKSDNIDEVRQLPAGIYIVNGKKITIR